MTVALMHIIAWQHLPSKVLGIAVIAFCLFITGLNITYAVAER